MLWILVSYITYITGLTIELCSQSNNASTELSNSQNIISRTLIIQGEAVYANFARESDFEELANNGIDVTNRIIVARYAAISRGSMVSELWENIWKIRLSYQWIHYFMHLQWSLWHYLKSSLLWTNLRRQEFDKMTPSFIYSYQSYSLKNWSQKINFAAILPVISLTIFEFFCIDWLKYKIYASYINTQSKLIINALRGPFRFWRNFIIASKFLK